MYKGEIVEIGQTEEIMNNPKHHHTKKLLEATLY
jgi:ABC-type dipeptide/oligopeptide/nickel transport system ATPase component